jgi:peptide/nickel transport system permease protein
MSAQAAPVGASIPSSLPAPRSRASRIAGQVRRRPIESAGGVILIGVVFTAFLAGYIAPFDYAAQEFGARLEGPSAAHFFGTDSLGRDVFSRVVYGARTSMLASTSGVFLSGVLGALMGVSSGFFGGKFDLVLQRITDGIHSVPLLLLAMLLVVAIGSKLPSLLTVAIALGLVGSTTVNRVVRGSTLAVKAMPYVEAAVSLGATSQRIVARHILPNVMAPLIVALSVQFGAFITAEASLSFLGLGVQPPIPSWGGMLSAEGRSFFKQAPWLALFPGIAISLTVLAANLVGDALRDILDPRQRGS